MTRKPRDSVTFLGAPGMNAQAWSATIRGKADGYEQYLVREVERLHNEMQEVLGIQFARCELRIELE